MRKKILSLTGIIIGSWFLEYIWIRWGMLCDLRIAGIHIIPLLILPLVSVWLILPKSMNLIEVFGRIGRLRWWIASAAIPAVSVLCAAGGMLLLGYARLNDGVDLAAGILTLLVDLPLNFVLWFPALMSAELCWRGVCRHGSEEGPNGFGTKAGCSFLWTLSLGGFAFTGFGEKGFSFLPGAALLCALFLIGWYQSILYRKSDSILVACFSLLCIVSMVSHIREFPFTGIEPLIEIDPKHQGASIATLLGSAILLWLIGLAAGGREERVHR